MGNLERQINDIFMGIDAGKPYEYDGPQGFHQFPVGAVIGIDLVGEKFEGLQFGEDQTIKVILRDNLDAVISVSEASHQPQLVGREIGLATDLRMMTRGGMPWPITLKGRVAVRKSMAYYFPEEIPPHAQYGYPETFYRVAANYKKITIGSIVLFGACYD